MVPWTQNDTFERMLGKLSVQILDEAELRSRLNQASPRLGLSERAALIAGLAGTRLMPSDPPPSLLIDQGEQIIPAQARVFLPPSESEAVSLPDWMSLRILHGGLSAELRRRLVVTGRGLTTALNDYSMTEFSLTSLSQALVAQANDRVRKEPEQEPYYRVEALQAIYKLYRQTGASLEKMRSSIATVHLPNITGGFAPANTLYFNVEFTCGRVCDMLYRPLDGRLIIAPVSEMGLEQEESDDLERYLRWLGVADTPRSVSLSVYGAPPLQSLPDEYREFTARRLKYPVKTDLCGLRVHLTCLGSQGELSKRRIGRAPGGNDNSGRPACPPRVDGFGRAHGKLASPRRLGCKS